MRREEKDRQQRGVRRGEGKETVLAANRQKNLLGGIRGLYPQQRFLVRKDVQECKDPAYLQIRKQYQEQGVRREIKGRGKRRICTDRERRKPRRRRVKSQRKEIPIKRCGRKKETEIQRRRGSEDRTRYRLTGRGQESVVREREKRKRSSMR